jgi:hypothetical protein
MRNWRLIVLVLLAAAALVLLCVGIFVTEHKFYSYRDGQMKYYETSDPIRIREWSFA